jgi:phosphatidylserine/phosphatidylglycerophosphate/cardiolipin synthase-like enzyme
MVVPRIPADQDYERPAATWTLPAPEWISTMASERGKPVRTAASQNGIHVKAYAGTTGVLLACDVEPGKRPGLLGFALERRVGNAKEWEWLLGKLNWCGAPQSPDQYFPSNEKPFQKFRWSDYRALPSTQYEYRIHPVYGSPEDLEMRSGPTVAVTTSIRQAGGHSVLFNRAAAASQAFTQKFPEIEAALDAARRAHQPPPPLPAAVLAWLSRGLLEKIVRFTERAKDASWALDVAIFEYELPAIVEAVHDAHARGASVRLLYHAKRPPDNQTRENERGAGRLPAAARRARITNRLCHHKFMVLSHLDGTIRRPVAVLTGSTNFTENGVYRQGNVVHIMERAGVARTYLNLFNELFAGADPNETKAYINDTNPIDVVDPVVVGFSPRSGRADLSRFISEVGSARRDVLFCTAFDLYDGLEAALLGTAGDPVVRFGLQNSRSEITGFHRDSSANFSATAFLSSGLEGFLEESTAGQRGNILVHTKLVVVDFTSEDPVVISGSHNFSVAASERNDENFVVIRGNTDVADCYGIELLRLYDHYRFRWAMKQEGTNTPCLTRDDKWANRYFRDRSLWWKDRRYFAGRS